MSRLIFCVALAVGVLCTSFCMRPAVAERRVALILGNSGYQNAPALPNPVNDAKAIAAMFQKTGFDVVDAEYDVGIVQFRRAIRRFMDDAANADIAVVYYAGHGIEIDGINYLIPVDAKLSSDRDADDEAVRLDRLVDSVEGAKQLRLIILDACRDNPFTRSMKLQRTAALVRGVNPGLGEVEPSDRSTLIAYAAKAGSEAEDGRGEHSPFTTALLNDLFVPGLDIRLAFGRVRDDVLKNTADRQEPFVYGSLGGGNIALVPQPEQQPSVGSSQEQPRAAADSGEKEDYSLVEKIGTLGAWQVFLKQYPKGFYSELARQQIAKLSAEPIKPPTTSGPSTEEQQAWDKIKDSSDPAAFRAFINQYPTSVLVREAQLHVQMIEQEQKTQALQRAEEEQQAQLAEAKRQADEARRKMAEQEAALKRAQEEAKAAEEARQQAERDAALKRQEEEEQKKAAAAVTAEQQPADIAAQQAALQRAQQEAKAAEEARQKAEAEAAQKRAEEARQTALAAAARAKEEADCKQQQSRLSSLQAAGSKALDDLKQLEQGLTCERLRPLVAAALEHANALRKREEERAAAQRKAKTPAARPRVTPAARPRVIEQASGGGGHGGATIGVGF